MAPVQKGVRRSRENCRALHCKQDIVAALHHAAHRFVCMPSPPVQPALSYQPATQQGDPGGRERPCRGVEERLGEGGREGVPCMPQASSAVLCCACPSRACWIQSTTFSRCLSRRRRSCPATARTASSGRLHDLDMPSPLAGGAALPLPDLHLLVACTTSTGLPPCRRSCPATTASPTCGWAGSWGAFARGTKR